MKFEIMVWALILLVVSAVSAVGGYHFRAYRAEKGKAEAVAALERQKAELQSRVDKLAQDLADAQANVRVVFKEIEVEAERHESEIADGQSFGDADVRLLNAAATGESWAEIPGTAAP